MSITSESIWAASPTTTRGLPTILSSDAKGERIAYASNKSIFIRSIDNPDVGRQYTGHTAQTTVAKFSPSGFYVASGDVSGAVKIWDCAGEGATKGDYHIIAGRINDIAWDGDSQRVIAVGDGKERYGHCITWDSGNSVGEISGHSAQINSVSIRQQRPLRAATGSDDASVVFLHGAPFKYNTSMRGKHQKFIYGTAFSPDGASLVSVGQDRRIWLYDGKTGEAKTQIGEGEHTGSIFGVSWSADSRHFATASADQTVKVWDAEAGKATQSWRMGGDGVSIADQQVGVTWPAGRADNLLVSADLDGNLNYLVPGTAAPTRVVRGHQKAITAITASSSASTPTLWTGSADGRIRAWDVLAGAAAPVDGATHSNYVAGLSASPEGARVSSIGWDDTLRTIDTNTRSFAGSGPASTKGQPRAVAASPTNAVHVASSAGLESFADGAPSGALDALDGATATALAAKADGSLLAVGTSSGSLLIYRPKPSGGLDRVTHLRDALPSAASALSFSPSGAHLAAGTASGGITVFASADWSVATTRWSAHSARVTSVAWRADGRHAASAGLDTNVFVWSLDAPGRRVKAAGAHKDGANGVVWIGEDRVASAGADAAVKTWKVEGL